MRFIQLSEKFMETSRWVSNARRFEIFSLIVCGILTVFAMTSILVTVRNIDVGMFSAVFLIVEGRAFSLISALFVLSYLVFLIFYLLLFEQFKNVVESEMYNIKSQMQGFDFGEIPEHIEDCIENFQKCATPIFGRSRKAIIVNILIVVLINLFYVSFVIRAWT